LWLSNSHVGRAIHPESGLFRCLRSKQTSYPRRIGFGHPGHWYTCSLDPCCPQNWVRNFQRTVRRNGYGRCPGHKTPGIRIDVYTRPLRRNWYGYVYLASPGIRRERAQTFFRGASAQASYSVRVGRIEASHAELGTDAGYRGLHRYAEMGTHGSVPATAPVLAELGTLQKWVRPAAFDARKLCTAETGSPIRAIHAETGTEGACRVLHSRRRVPDSA